MLEFHVRTGIPIHPKTRDKWIEQAQPDDAFNEKLRLARGGYEYDQERYRASLEEMRPYMERIRRAIDG
jgi:hypothetical protein